MGEVVTPVDAEALAVGYLKAELASRSDTAAVATKVANPRPVRSVRVWLAGTNRQTPVHFYARLVFECRDASPVDASQLARLAYALMKAAEGADYGAVWVADVVDVSGPAYFPDPDAGPRYQFTLDVLIRGT